MKSGKKPAHAAQWRILAGIMLSSCLGIHLAEAQSISFISEPNAVEGIVTACADAKVELKANMSTPFGSPFFPSSATADLFAKPVSGNWPSTPVASKSAPLVLSGSGPVPVYNYSVTFSGLQPAAGIQYRVRYTYQEGTPSSGLQTKVRYSGIITVELKRCTPCAWRYSDLNKAATNVAGDLATDATGKVYYRNKQGHLNAIYWDGSKWNYSDLNKAATNVGGELVADVTGKIFYRNKQGHLNAIYFAGGKWNYGDLNKAATNVAGDLATDASGKVYYRSKQGHLNAIYWSGGKWNYSDLNKAATNVAGDLATDASGKVYYRSTQGHLNAIYWDGGKWNYSDLNKAATNVAGDLVTDASGKIFYRSKQGHLNAIYWDGGKWNYSDLNKAATNVAGSLATDASSKIYYRSTSGHLNAIYWDCPEVQEATWTPWLNRDLPGGSGDWETLADFVKAGQACANPTGIQCQTVSGQDWTATGQVYACTPGQGGICRNADQPGGAICLDYRVRFRC